LKKRKQRDQERLLKTLLNSILVEGDMKPKRGVYLIGLVMVFIFKIYGRMLEYQEKRR